MLLDQLANAQRYERLHPRFAEAFAWLLSGRFESLSDGRQEIDGNALFAICAHDVGRGRDAARLEVHRRYIDIQYVAAGVESIGWQASSACRVPAGSFDVDKDIGFYADPPATWLTVPPGYFAVFFPEDAHAPLAAEGQLHKVVVKVAV
jgi:biofilm protein TabA